MKTAQPVDNLSIISSSMTHQMVSISEVKSPVSIQSKRKEPALKRKTNQFSREKLVLYNEKLENIEG